MKKRSKFFWIVARIVNHIHEQNPTKFLNLHGKRNSKIMNCCSTTASQKGRRIVAQCHVIFLCTALQQVFPLVVVAHCHPFWLKAVYLPFSRKIEHYIHLHCNKTSGYNLMCMLFSPRAAVSSLGTCIIHAEEGTGRRASIRLHVLAMYIMQVLCYLCVHVFVCVHVCMCVCVCARARNMVF
jgi:hypothetical protein